MSKKTFLVIKIITAAILGAVVALSVNYGNWKLPVIVVLTAFVFLNVSKKRVTEVMEDERDYRIAGKASRVAMTVYVMVSVILGLILYIAGRQNSAMFAAGNVMVYSACFLMFIYSVLFKIYAKRDERD
jgi:uncharacterized membrane protein